MNNFENKKILLIICGGIAAYKSLEIIRLLKKKGALVKTILTKNAHKFVTPLSVTSLSQEKIYSDLFDHNNEAEMDHISLSRWSDLILIAPATANTMSKISYGTADDLASTVVLASNNYLSFNTGNANAYCDWTINNAVPSNADPPMNAILCPWQDIYPGVNGNGTIQYATTGESPNRVFIASFCGIPMFSCTDICYSSQIKLFESTNVIETHIAQKAVAAMREGITKVIVPAANSSELSLLPPEVLEATIEFIPVRTMDEVISEALTTPGKIPSGVHEGKPLENMPQAQ